MAQAAPDKGTSAKAAASVQSDSAARPVRAARAASTTVEPAPSKRSAQAAAAGAPKDAQAERGKRKAPDQARPAVVAPPPDDATGKKQHAPKDAAKSPARPAVEVSPPDDAAGKKQPAPKNAGKPQAGPAQDEPAPMAFDFLEQVAEDASSKQGKSKPAKSKLNAVVSVPKAQASEAKKKK